MLNNLIKICDEKNLNISIIGYKNFNPLKPDLAANLQDLFPSVVQKKCGDINAF